MCPQVFTSLNGFRRNLDLNIFCESLYVGLCSALLSVSSIAVPARLSRIFILISVYRFVPTVFSRGRGPTNLRRGPMDVCQR